MAHTPRARRARSGAALACLAGVGLAGVGLAGMLEACGGPTDDRDASRDAVVLDGELSARVAVELEADLSSLEDDTTLERLTVGVVETHAPNDRGDLSVEVQRSFELSTERAMIMLTSATPGVYGGVGIQLGSGAWGAPLVLRVRQLERVLEVTLEEPILLEGRCDSPLALEPGRRLSLRAGLDVGEAVHMLDEATLPEPIDGVVHIDARSAPSAVAMLVPVLRELRLDCEEMDVEAP